MRVADELRLVKGVVSPSFIDLSTGRKVPFPQRHNTLSYMAAEAVAAAFGGDPSYIPARMGFIYGNSQDMPSGESVITRNQSWDALLEEIGSTSGSATADIQVVNFSYAPTLGAEPRSGSSGSSADDDDYNHILPTGSNAITFHAVSNSMDRGILDTAETFKDGRYIYQCVLLGYHQKKYYVIARASLKDFNESSGSGEGAYLRKPSGFEVALDWTVVFH